MRYYYIFVDPENIVRTGHITTRNRGVKNVTGEIEKKIKLDGHTLLDLYEVCASLKSKCLVNRYPWR